MIEKFVNDGKCVKIAGMSKHREATLSARFEGQIEDVGSEKFL